MGISCDFFIAYGATIPNYDLGQEFDNVDKYKCKGLTTLEGAKLLAILRRQEYSVDLISEFKLVTPEDEETWTMSVSQDMVTRLASIAKRLRTGESKTPNY
jgi:hypothetical protein